MDPREWIRYETFKICMVLHGFLDVAHKVCPSSVAGPGQGFIISKFSRAGPGSGLTGRYRAGSGLNIYDLSRAGPGSGLARCSRAGLGLDQNTAWLGRVGPGRAYNFLFI